MKSIGLRYVLLTGLALSVASPWLVSHPVRAQVPPWGMAPPPAMIPVTPQSQRAVMTSVQSRVKWLQNATRTAPNYGTGGDGQVWRALQELRTEYTMFTRTLTMRQADYGANELAELSAGLDILEEGIGNYQQDVASGRLPGRALLDMCQLMSKGANMWLQEFNRACMDLHVGR